MFQLSRTPLRRHERITLQRAYAGEFGRGIYAALALDFSLTIAMTHFGIVDTRSIWLLSAAPFIGHLTAVFATTLTASYRKKTLIFAFEILSRLAFIVAASVTSGPAFVVLMAFGMGFNALGVPLVSGIYGSNFSASVRGRAMGRLQAISVGTTSAVARPPASCWALAPSILFFSSACSRPSVWRVPGTTGGGPNRTGARTPRAGGAFSATSSRSCLPTAPSCTWRSSGSSSAARP